MAIETAVCPRISRATGPTRSLIGPVLESCQCSTIPRRWSAPGQEYCSYAATRGEPEHRQRVCHAAKGNSPRGRITSTTQAGDRVRRRCSSRRSARGSRCLFSGRIPYPRRPVRSAEFRPMTGPFLFPLRRFIFPFLPKCQALCFPLLRLIERDRRVHSHNEKLGLGFRMKLEGRLGR
jgi:hypothetical protein